MFNEENNNVSHSMSPSVTGSGSMTMVNRMGYGDNSSSSNSSTSFSLESATNTNESILGQSSNFSHQMHDNCQNIGFSSSPTSMLMGGGSSTPSTSSLIMQMPPLSPAPSASSSTTSSSLSLSIDSSNLLLFNQTTGLKLPCMANNSFYDSSSSTSSNAVENYPIYNNNSSYLNDQIEYSYNYPDNSQCQTDSGGCQLSDQHPYNQYPHPHRELFAHQSQPNAFHQAPHDDIIMNSHYHPHSNHSHHHHHNQQQPHILGNPNTLIGGPNSGDEPLSLGHYGSAANLDDKLIHDFATNFSSTFSYSSSSSSSKQDVSVGSDVPISRDSIKFKKDFDWLDNYKPTQPLNNHHHQSMKHNHHPDNQQYSIRTNSSETFKLVEKAQPKKSRTKYTKDQIDLLETAYCVNPYPDLITVEHLCKSLGICKEKINIWFQNRRARSKRNGA